MGIWRSAGEFPVVKRQRKCGRKTAGMHFSQPMNIGVSSSNYFILFTSRFVYLIFPKARRPKMEIFNL